MNESPDDKCSKAKQSKASKAKQSKASTPSGDFHRDVAKISSTTTTAAAERGGNSQIVRIRRLVE
jgi:hypothetical protein